MTSDLLALANTSGPLANSTTSLFFRTDGSADRGSRTIEHRHANCHVCPLGVFRSALTFFTMTPLAKHEQMEIEHRLLCCMQMHIDFLLNVPD